MLTNIFLVILLVIVLSLVCSLTIDQPKDKEKAERTSPALGRPYVCRYSYFNPNPTEKVDCDTGTPGRWAKGDCAVRAFCGVLELSWDEVFSDLCRIGAECHDLPNADEVIDRYAKEKGLVKRILRPKSTVSEFAGTHDGTYLLILKGHAVCVKGNRICDTGDCGYAKVREYYEKGGLPAAETALDARKRKVKEPSAIEREIIEGLERRHGQPNESFSYFNPNPEATEAAPGDPSAWEKGDNVIRALCGVLNRPWGAVYHDLCEIAKETHDMPDSRKIISRFLKEKGFARRRLPSPMPLSRFAASHEGVYLVQLSWGMEPHVTCVKDHHIFDIWDFGEFEIRTFYEKLT